VEERTTSVTDWVEVIQRRKLAFLIPALLVLVAAAIITVALTPIYQSTATILIEEQEIPQDFVMSTVTTFVEQRLQTINQRIMSFTRLLEIINRFNLYADKRGRWTTEQIVAEMRDDITFEPISADVVDRRTGRPMTATIAFTVSYENKNPETVHQVANVLASLYLEENIQARERQALETSTFLAEEMQNIKARLAELDKSISQFKQQHINELPELLNVNLQGLDRVEQEIQRLNEQLRMLREREGSLQTQLASAPTLSADKQRLDELRVQLVYLQSRFSDQYPEVLKTRSEIAELERRLGVTRTSKDGTRNNDFKPDNPVYITIASQLSSTQADVRSVKQQIADANKRLTEYQRRVEATPRVEEEYRVLIAERDNTQLKLNDLMAKSMEAKVAHGLEKEQKAERFTLIDPPRLPEEPSKPNRLAIILIGLVLAIGAGVGVAAIREFTDQSIRSDVDLGLHTSLPVLGSVPVIETKQERIRKERRRGIIILGILVAIIAALLIVHFFVIDFEILWLKVARRMGW